MTEKTTIIKQDDIKKASQIMSCSLEELSKTLGISRFYLFQINKKRKRADKEIVKSQLKAITLILQSYIRDAGVNSEKELFNIIMTEQMFNVKQSDFDDPRFKAAFKHCLKIYNKNNKLELN